MDNDNDNGMKIGLRLPQTDEHRATRQNVIKLSTEAENAGIDSLWVLERLIWPIKPQTNYPGLLMANFQLIGNIYLSPWRRLPMLQQIQTKLH